MTPKAMHVLTLVLTAVSMLSAAWSAWTGEKVRADLAEAKLEIARRVEDRTVSRNEFEQLSRRVEHLEGKRGIANVVASN